MLVFLALTVASYLRWRRRRLADEAAAADKAGQLELQTSQMEAGKSGDDYVGASLKAGSPQPSNEVALLSEFVGRWRNPRTALTSSKWSGSRADTPDSLAKASLGSLPDGADAGAAALPEKWITGKAGCGSV